MKRFLLLVAVFVLSTASFVTAQTQKNFGNTSATKNELASFGRAIAGLFAKYGLAADDWHELLPRRIISPTVHPLQRWPEMWPKEELTIVVPIPNSFWDGRMDIQCLATDITEEDVKCDTHYHCATCHVKAGRNPMPIFPFFTPLAEWDVEIWCYKACVSD